MGFDVEVRAVVNGSGLVRQAGACDSGNKGELSGGSARQGRVAETQQRVAVINDSSA